MNRQSISDSEIKGEELERGLFRLCAPSSDLLVEMAMRGLVPGKTLTIESLISSEVLVRIDSEVDAEIARRNLPQVIQQMQVAFTHPSYGRYLRDTWGLPPEQKMRLVCERLEAWRERFPKRIEAQVMVEASRFTLATPPAYRSLREAGHLARLIAALARFRRLLNEDERKLRVRLFPTRLRFPFGIKPVTGVLVGTILRSSYELLEERHLEDAVRRINPRIQLVQGSALLLREHGEGIVLLYAEFEGDPLALQDRLTLQSRLPGELAEGIEQLTHALFMRRNEEETLRTILTLSSELREKTDLPQVSINFIEQSQESITYSVILLSYQEIEKHLPQQSENFRIHFEWRKMMSESKVANVFCVELRKTPFLRKDYAVDLYRARRYVVSILTDAVGEVRDYNGGLIIKQEEVLVAAKRHLSEEQLGHDHLLDRFFYSLTPAAIQGALPPSLVATLLDLFCLALGMPPRTHEILERECEGQLLLVIRVLEESYRDAIHNAVDLLKIDPLLLPRASVEAKGSFFMGFALLRGDTGKWTQLRSAIEDALNETAERVRAERYLRISLPRLVNSLDPRLGGDRRSGIVIKTLYEGLTRIGRDGHAEPAIAKRIAISPDQCTYTFELRESFWSDGTPVTAYDFEYGWKKALEPTHKQRWTYMFHAIKNAEAATQGRVAIEKVGVDAIDDRTLRVELEHPAPYFLDLTAHWLLSPLRSDIDKDRPGWAYLSGDTFVCNGPFQVAEFRRGDKIHLIKNPHYWDAKAVHLRGIDVSLIGDPQITTSMFQQGQLDLIGEPLCQFPPDIDIEAERDARYFSMPAPGLFWYLFNVERPPFTSQAMRRAFCLAINRAKLIADANLRDLKPAFGFFPERQKLGNEPAYTDGDLDRAQYFFKQALAELGEIPSVTIYYPSFPTEEKVTNLVADQLREAFNLKIYVEAVPWQQYIEQLESGEFQMGCFSWYAWLSDPIYNLEHFKHKGQFLNFSRFEKTEYVDLLNRSDHTADAKERNAMLRKAEKILFEEMPVLPVCHERYRYLVKNDLRGLRISDLGQIDFKHAYFGRKPTIRSEQPKQRLLRAALSSRIGSLSPGEVGDRLTQQLTQLLYTGLMRPSRYGAPSPSLAHSYTVSDDGKRYTFKLRASLWSDGAPLRAADFIRGWHRTAASPWSYSTSSIHKMSTPDDHTLIVDLHHPAPYFLELAANPMLYPAPLTTAYNGPFVLTSRNRDGDLLMMRNPHYWDAHSVQLDGVQLDVIDDPHTAYSLFQQGELDYLGEPFTALPKEAEAKLNLIPQSIMGMFEYAFNCERFPFTSPKIRKAFALAVDRKISSPLPPPLSESSPCTSDSKLALQLFEEGLRDLGVTRKEIGTITLSHAVMLGFDEISQKVRRRWQELFNIPVAFEYIEWSNYITSLGNPQAQVMAAVWISWVNDPSYNLKNIHLITRWHDPSYSAVLQQADNEIDPTQRLSLLRQAEEMVIDAMPVIPMQAITYPTIKNPSLESEWITPQGLLVLHEAALRPGQK